MGAVKSDSEIIGSAARLLTDAIIYKDLAGKVLGWDRNAERIFGYQPDEIIGRSIDTIIPAERRAEEAAIIERLNGGDSIEGLETLRVAKDGTLRRVALSIAPVRGNDGKVVAAVKFVRNINSSSIEGSEPLLLRAREAEHRAKNILATILSMTRLSQAGTVVELKDVISGRIRALADVTSLTGLLYDKGADIKHIITNEFWSTRNEVASRVSIDGPTIILGADQSQCIAMIVHELVTNSIKYGALSQSKGKVGVKWRLHPATNAIDLHWTETASGIAKPLREGFGSKLIKSIASRTLRGSSEFVWSSQGLQFQIHFPIS